MLAVQMHFKAKIHKNLTRIWNVVALFTLWMKKNHIKKGSVLTVLAFYSMF